MKSKAKDKRAQKTCAALEKAFLELIQTEELKKITITKVTEKANTNRSTFYLHYYDIYDLLDSVEDKIIEKIHFLLFDSETKSEKEFNAEPMLRYIKDNRSVFQTILKHDNVFHFFDKLTEMCKKALLTEIVDKKHFDREKFPKLNCFFVGGVISLLRDWLEKDIDSVTPKQLAKIIEYITVTFIDAFNNRQSA